VEEAVGIVRANLRNLVLWAAVLLGLPTARAQTTAQAQGYLYVEPYAGRFEMVVDLPTALRWVQLSHDSLQVVTPADQERYRTELQRAAGDWCTASHDNEAATTEVKGITFLKGAAGNAQAIAPEDQLEAPTLQVGITWEFALRGAPERVEVRWKQFQPPLSRIPVAVYQSTGKPEEVFMNAPLGNARWENKGRLPKPRAASAVPEFVVPQYFRLPIAMLIWLILGVAIWVWVLSKGLKFPGGITPFLAAWLIGIIVTMQAGYLPIPMAGAPKSEPVTTPEAASKIIQPILENSYRALDYRTAPEVKDRLAGSMAKELTQSFYERALKLLALEGGDGTRARVQKVGLTLENVKSEGEGFTCDAEWSLVGTAQHWGHPDQRVGRVRAKLTAQPSGTTWKLSTLAITEERGS
jgi:hypothetical protein